MWKHQVLIYETTSAILQHVPTECTAVAAHLQAIKGIVWMT